VKQQFALTNERSQPRTCRRLLLRSLSALLCVTLLTVGVARANDRHDVARPARSTEMLREDARQILQAEEFQQFQRIHDRALKRLDEKKAAEKFDAEWLSALAKWLKVSDSLSSVLGLLMHGLAWTLLAMIVALIVHFVIRAIRDYERRRRGDDAGPTRGLEGEEEPEHAPGDLAADAYVTRAKALAASGRYAEAVSHLLLGAMSSIERADLIRYRRGLTYRDYLRAIRSQGVPFAALDTIVRLYEPIGFGRREATSIHFRQSLARYEKAFVDAMPSGQGTS